MSVDSTATTSTQANLKPHLWLAVGITGHRMDRLCAVDLPALEAAIAALLALVQTSASAVAARHAIDFATPRANLRLVSALAEGADTITAEAALKAGWRLDACLPFARDEYAHDFADYESREKFETLLAAATSTFALAGDRANADVAYEAVGRVVLDQSDILLALWDGDAGRGRGGTARVVAEAVSRHIPVLHIDISGRHAPLLLWSGLTDIEIEAPNIDNVPRADAGSTLAPVVAALCMPPENADDRRMLARFYAERLRRRTPVLPYPLLLALTGTRKFSWADTRPVAAETCEAPLAAQLTRVAHADSFGEALMSNVVARFGVADAAAAYFAQVFRSGFVANFGLATIAVLLALSGPLLPAYKLPLIITELVIIFIIFLNTRAGRRAGWHECWMDDRHLAEQLRALAMTSTLGNLNLRASSGRDAASLPGWVQWLARATARELGMPRATADAGYLANVRDAAIALIDNQVAYHRSNADRMRKLEHRLHSAGEVLFGGTIVACTAWIIAKLGGVPMAFSGGLGLTEIVTWLTAAMPALGSAFYGIRMQGDFAGVAYRSTVTVARLERLKRALETDPLDYTRLIGRQRRLADIMLTDVAHWRTTYQARPLTLPG
jgi:hypothetical protein